VNVKEAFIELVEKVNGLFLIWVTSTNHCQILDNPSLYAPVGAKVKTTTTANNRTMPGAINLNATDDDHGSGCSC